jgi:hypothetical protein
LCCAMGRNNAVIPTSFRSKKRTGGSALVIVMCIAAILLIVAASLMSMSTFTTHRVMNMRRSAQAQAMAEAGVADALARLSQDFEGWKLSSFETNFGNGSYSVTITTNGKTGAIIECIGTCEGKSRSAVLETLGHWRSAWNTNDFAEYGILAEGLIDANGQGILYASLHSGTSVEIAPNVLITGSVNSEGSVKNQGSVGGAVAEYADPVECPTFNFEYFVQLARAGGGDVFSNSVSFKNEVVAPSSGITCVYGDVKIQNGAVIKGAVIATGEIDMQGGHVEHIPIVIGGEIMPSLMSVNSGVSIRSGQILHGFVYAKGDVMINGGDVIYGGVIAGGIVDARNDWVVHPGDAEIPPGVNPGDGGEVTRVRIGAWIR